MAHPIVIKPPMAVIGEKSWKRFVHVAEARLKEPRFGLETKDTFYTVKALLPGVIDVKDVEVAIVDHHLRIDAVSRQSFVSGEQASAPFRYIRERPINAAFLLPPDVDESSFSFEMNRGVLQITIPRIPSVAVDATEVAPTSEI